MNEIISILQNPEKMEYLISKLKTIGEDSPQFQILKASIDSFHLNKPPRGVHEKNILQHVFKYSNSRECFNSFRLVCKSWQNAVETIRLDARPPSEIFQELYLHERNGHFSPFYSKYLQTFRKLGLHLDTCFDMTKWNSISNLLLNNMKNLGSIVIRISHPIPTDFVIFLFKLFKNSKSTLKSFGINCRHQIGILPSISLQNLTYFFFTIYPNHGVESFDYLMQTFVYVMCPDLKIFIIVSINNSHQILKYIAKNYPNHFVCGPEISVLEHIPLKISHLNLENLAAYRFISQIEYLILHVKNFQVPSEGGWDNYTEILSFFSNLKGVIFYHKRKYTNLDSSISYFSYNVQNIWQQRIDYFKSQNIKILCTAEYLDIISKLRQSLSPSWSFQFEKI